MRRRADRLPNPTPIDSDGVPQRLIKTEFARALWENPAILEPAAAHSCLKRIGQPDEIAGMAVFLASKAGGFTSGQTYVIAVGAMAV
jgi:NAD(P)-dependent dehydrogenase (short-subunit alcohol dehydrogenase family)